MPIGALCLGAVALFLFAGLRMRQVMLAGTGCLVLHHPLGASANADLAAVTGGATHGGLRTASARRRC